MMKKGPAIAISVHTVLAELPAVYFIMLLDIPIFRTIADVTELNSVEIAIPESTMRSAVIPRRPIMATP